MDVISSQHRRSSDAIIDYTKDGSLAGRRVEERKSLESSGSRPPCTWQNVVCNALRECRECAWRLLVDGRRDRCCHGSSGNMGIMKQKKKEGSGSGSLLKVVMKDCETFQSVDDHNVNDHDADDRCHHHHHLHRHQIGRRTEFIWQNPFLSWKGLTEMERGIRVCSVGREEESKTEDSRPNSSAGSLPPPPGYRRRCQGLQKNFSTNANRRTRQKEIVKLIRQHGHEKEVGTGCNDGVLVKNVGNLTNVLKSAPSKAIDFFAFDFFKQMLARRSKDLPPEWQRFLAGAMAGATGQAVVYPLEVVSSHLAVSKGRTMSQVFAQILRNEGPVGLYRGLGPSVIGMIPYAGINFGVYDLLQEALKRAAGARNREVGVLSTMFCGMVASGVGMMVSFPLEVVRRRLQVQTLYGDQKMYKGMIDAILRILEEEGLAAFYKGWLPSAIKVVPAAAASFATYEVVKHQVDCLQKTSKTKSVIDEDFWKRLSKCYGEMKKKEVYSTA
ncbi:hypothetical protein CBR_g48166 [Chara braunii]|uniref:Uncharacterized protein n=1 Tax=Chara braunii TaxID=69332 RepID=A0A388M292_CHABU|nr:hypothetical protein CBR_g48166 [Chara braunii]|eukprot:GBG88635.1 hypothetical protein CBR_g48166 [Chara braunii]